MAYEFKDIKVKDFTIASIEGCKAGSGEVVFTSQNGDKLRLYHEQDCCESVYIEEVHGDPKDLVGHKICMFEEASHDCTDEVDNYGSALWTFYKIATSNADLTIRWLGMSNGYYSERVSIELNGE